MGPRLDGRGDHVQPVMPAIASVMLQWGRGLMAAVTGNMSPHPIDMLAGFNGATA